MIQTGLIVIIVIILLLTFSKSRINSKYDNLPIILPEELNTGDIWLGNTDFSKQGKLNQTLFFEAVGHVARWKFSHCGIIYRDDRFHRSDPRSLYVWTVQQIPWNFIDTNKYPWATVGSHFIPFTAICALYEYNIVTPLHKPMDKLTLEKLVNTDTFMNDNMAVSSKDYALLILRAFFDANGARNDNGALFCSDIIERKMRNGGKFMVDRSVVLLSDLVISTNARSSVYYKFNEGEGLKPTCRVCVVPKSTYKRPIKMFEREWKINRAMEKNLLYRV